MRLFVFCRGLRRIRRMAVVGRGVKFFSHGQSSICSVFALALPFSRDTRFNYFSGLCCLSSGITDLSLFGIASRP
jgi:hypothetical protein